MPLQIYDQELRTWKEVLVVGYQEEAKLHTVKFRQELLTLQLGQYRVRLLPSLDKSSSSSSSSSTMVTMEDPLTEKGTSPNTKHLLQEGEMNKQTNNIVIEIQDGVRRYRGPKIPEELPQWNYHTQPQVVGNSIPSQQ